MFRKCVLAAAVALVVPGTAMAQSKGIKIGYISTFSGPAASCQSSMGWHIGRQWLIFNVTSSEALRAEARVSATIRTTPSPRCRAQSRASTGLDGQKVFGPPNPVGRR